MSIRAGGRGKTGLRDTGCSGEDLPAGRRIESDHSWPPVPKSNAGIRPNEIVVGIGMVFFGLVAVAAGIATSHRGWLTMDGVQLCGVLGILFGGAKIGLGILRRRV